jgi:hypothetical protein
LLARRGDDRIRPGAPPAMLGESSESSGIRRFGGGIESLDLPDSRAHGAPMALGVEAAAIVTAIGPEVTDPLGASARFSGAPT